MDPKHISNLADLLRQNGDKILNSEFKLTLSGQLLRSLNDAFTLIADQSELTAIQGFQVVKPNNSKSNVFRDLQLIYDFVQKTILLCITSFPGDEPFDGPIDITKFRSLERLEIQKFNVNQINGIQPLRSNLKQIICVRSLNRIEDIITHCGKDNSNGFVWNELKIADFSYNNLQKADTSLEFAQNLINLNLSHNRLTSVEAVKWLPNLKILDLSFNRLTHIPSFHNDSTRHLLILILNNNYVEDLCGISRLDVLTELNLAENCLLNHSYLLPLSTLAALRYLNLYGNPLYCHPKHRSATCNYLHKNVVTTKFILDSDALSKSEKSLTGFYQSYNTVLTTRLIKIKKSVGTSTSTPTSSNHSKSNTPASSLGSVHSFVLPKNNQLDNKNKLKKNRTVDIEDISNTDLAIVTKSASKSEKTSKTLISSQDHLKTKQQIEDLRNKFGPDWLQSENVQTVEILQGPQKEEETSKLTSQELIDSILDSMNISRKVSIDNQSASTSTPIIDNSQFKLNESPIKSSASAVAETPTKSFNTEYTSFATESEIGNSVYKSTVDSNLDRLWTRSSSFPQDDQVASDPEDNEVTYIVYEKDSTEQLFVTVSDLSIKEKDTLTRRTINKWSLKILKSCDRIKSNTLRINFDTVKESKKERIYTVEEDLCQELESFLRKILSKRKLSEMNQITYRCVQCSCPFSQEITNDYKRKNQVVACPECKSQFVAEVVDNIVCSFKDQKSSSKNYSVTEKSDSKRDTEAKTTISTESKQLQSQQEQSHHNFGENSLIEGSTSHSSIDVHKGKGNRSVASKKVLSSANSLNESSSCSKLNSQSSLDSTQSVAGSLPNERENDFNNGNAIVVAKNRMLNKDGRDSDVEILSNPSESSIEVLDGNIQNLRKTSSEERRISIAPSLETIEDNVSQRVNFHIGQGYKNEAEINLMASTKDFLAEEKKDLGSSSNVDKKTNQNLTESSSSGSVTDSICTTYEQNNGRDQLLDTDSKTSFSTVLGGLLQSTNILLSRNQKTTDGKLTPHCEKFKFNYTDFSDIDHRLKFYFYQSKFESNEHFKWLVKTKLFNETTQSICDSLVIMSTHKLYLMQICGPENDDITKWVKQIHCSFVNRIEQIKILPFKVGLSIKIKALGGFLLILQDILRTDSLLLFFANNPLPSDCQLHYQTSETVMKKLSQIAGGEQLYMFSIINSCELSCEDSIKNYETSAFFTTNNSLYLATSNLSWLAARDDSDETLDLVDFSLMQMISNLVEVDRLSDTVFSINFLDETQDKSEFWKVTFETKENAESSLNAISQSWEKLFGVPLLEKEFK